VLTQTNESSDAKNYVIHHGKAILGELLKKNGKAEKCMKGILET
jgi:hypothetical protein